jgi:hypothetical protein
MKFPFLLTGLLWLTLMTCAQSQKDTAATKIEDTTVSKINLSSLPKSNIRLYLPAKAGSTFYLFNHFEVIDERPDKALIGVRTNKTSSMFSGRDRQLVFDSPAATGIANYFNHNFTRPGASLTALIILRSLWVSDAMYIPHDMTKDQDKKLGWGHIHLKAEIYATKDSLYTPIVRYDTLLRETTSAYHLSANPSYSMLESDLSGLLINLADSASWIARSKQGNSHQITRQQIDDFNQTRFTSPFDNTTAYTRGVYMNFEEFRNNAPSVLDFEIKNENKDQQLLYIKDASGVPYYSRTAWGYCDGKSIFIMQDGFLCPAWKEGSAFYFYAVSEQTQVEGGGYNPGTASIRSPTGAVIPGTPGSISPSYEVKKKERSIYALDMDTGNAY